MADLEYICNFLTQVEGKCQLTGYVPCNKKGGGTANYKGGPNPENFTAMGASGVTIATGCDLGQTDAATLSAYGLAPSIISIYSPYLGKKKDQAIRALHDKPFGISREQAEATDDCVHIGYLNRYVRPVFERDSDLAFDDLPKQAQAVVMSICFHKGCGGVRKEFPKTWGFLCAGNWQAAAKELCEGFTQFAPRRRTEGLLLLELC